MAQADDPGAVGAGVLWTDTNADLTYRRNDTNTDWILLGGAAAVSSTEYGYLDGVTSAIQTQLAAKLSTVTTQRVGFATTFTTSSTTMVDVTGFTITIANRTGVKAIVVADIRWLNDTTLNLTYFRFVNNAVNESEHGVEAPVTASRTTSNVIATNNETANSVVKVQTAETGGIAVVSILGTTAGQDSHITVLEVS